MVGTPLAIVKKMEGSSQTILHCEHGTKYILRPSLLVAFRDGG
jgi:hypothetical protein